MFIKISRCLAIFSPSLVGLLFSSKTSVQMTFSFLLCLASEASDADEEWPEVKLPFVVGILNESFHSRTDVTARARLEGKWSLNIHMMAHRHFVISRMLNSIRYIRAGYTWTYSHRLTWSFDTLQSTEAYHSRESRYDPEIILLAVPHLDLWNQCCKCVKVYNNSNLKVDFNILFRIFWLIWVQKFLLENWNWTLLWF